MPDHSLPRIAVVLLLSIKAAAIADGPSTLTFEKHVRPILKAQCFHCHGEDEELHGGLDLRLVRLMQQGGDSGEPIITKDVSESLLWQRIESDEMPEGTKKLSADQKVIIRQWLEQGANTARPEPASVEEARFTNEELEHWAYQPIASPAIPTVPCDIQTPIDNFIAAKLADRQLEFSPQAERHTLIRRVTFDLTGLPPSPNEVRRFVADNSPNAYEHLVERLLASPQFGVRWGRHWLDVAGYAESNGGQAGDSKREQAWRYRDYVINAFNENKLVDQFILEQLAGDELIEGQLDILNDRHYELLTATGFLRMAPDPTQNSNTLSDRNLATADAIKVISSTMLGVTVGCAQCHDHKYDPIGIDDYYRFRAVFDPIFPLENWQQPNTQVVDFTTEEVNAEAARIEAEAKVLEGDLNKRRDALAKKIQELKLNDVPEPDRDATRTAVLTESGKRTDEQIRLLKQYPMVKPIGNIIGLLVEYDTQSYRKFEKELENIAAIRARKPAKRLVWATRERPNVVPVSTIFFRGNPESPREQVAPGELMVLRRNGRDVSVPTDDKSKPTTGRRTAYARQLTERSHPLTARVFVNRVWLHYMGSGIVPTPSDFGISGERPTHPDLLDWLANDFVQNDWDQKRLHRMILLSRTYQQVTTRTPRRDEVDPENRLYARMSLRRLEAEAIRDAILSVVGGLNTEIGGASIPVTEDPEGKVVIGKRKIRDGLKAEVLGGNADAARRSAYIEIQRTLPLNVLATFDQPMMNPNCELRNFSTVATQSLWFLNDSMIVDRSRELAKSILKTRTSAAAIQELFLRLFAAEASNTELNTCLHFLDEQQRHFETQDTDKNSTEAKFSAMAALCQTMMASNRFLYLD